MNTAVLAIDIGASSGRHMLGKLENGKLTLEEIYRFPNGTVKKNGRLCWDHQALWAHILAGMKKCAELGQIPASVGVDTWGVDYVLVDEDGRMLSDGVAYRDDRTQAVLGLLPDDELYRRTGIAKQPFNTVYQLMTEPKERLQKAHRLLFTPDHFHYLLSGKMVNEYTIASTGALVNPVTRTWDAQVLRMAGVPESLFPEAPKMPGTVLGRLRPEVAAEVGFDCSVILPASHDTGSAYMAVPARDDRAAYLSSGTWSLLGTELDAPILTADSCQSGLSNELGANGKINYLKNIIGLWLIQESRREYKRRGQAYSFAELEQQALAAEPLRSFIDPDAPEFVAPGDLPSRIQEFCRKTGQPIPETAGAVMRCIYESLALKYRYAIEQLSAVTGRAFTTLHVLGGGTKDRLLCQMTADCCGLTVKAGPVEATALGNIMIQLKALGVLDSITQGRRLIAETEVIKTYTPSTQNYAEWNAAYDRFKALL